MRNLVLLLSITGFALVMVDFAQARDGPSGPVMTVGMVVSAVALVFGAADISFAVYKGSK